MFAIPFTFLVLLTSQQAKAALEQNLVVAPQIMEGSIRISADGLSGINGLKGMDYSYSRARSGMNGFSGSNGGDGDDGRNGGNATAGGNGLSAGRIEVHINRQPGSEKFNITGFVQYVTGTKEKFAFEDVALSETQKLLLSVRGGRGGSGGIGGGGQDGGDGGTGGEAGRWNNRSGDGGRGGRGGDGGLGARGGNGGNAGTIVVYYPKANEEILKFIQTDVGGGFGGNGGEAGRGGDGGRGGDPGRECFFEDGAYKCGFRGMYGMNGFSGRIPFHSREDGANGQDGHLEVHAE